MTLPALLVTVVTAFSDSFDDGVPGPLWASMRDTVGCPGLDLEETGSQLRVTSADNAASNCYAWYRTTSANDLRGAEIRVRVVDPGTPSPYWLLYLLVDAGGADRVGMVLTNQLVLVQQSGLVVAQRPWAGGAWLRVFEANGVLTF